MRLDRQFSQLNNVWAQPLKKLVRVLLEDGEPEGVKLPHWACRYDRN